jgi:adenylate kinase
MKIIAITGSVGCGKTTLAKKIAKKIKGKYVDVNKIINKYKLSESYDKKRKSKIIDVKKLNKVLIGLIKKSKQDLVIDSHLSHYLPSKYVNLCIVTKCDLKILKKRLKKRDYSEDKIRENLDAEIFDVCLNEVKEKGHNVLVIDTTKGLKSLNFLNNI